MIDKMQTRNPNNSTVRACRRRPICVKHPLATSLTILSSAAGALSFRRCHPCGIGRLDLQVPDAEPMLPACWMDGGRPMAEVNTQIADAKGVPQRSPDDVAGYVERPMPRWSFVLAGVVYAAWLVFLLVMVWVRTTDPHYMGP